MADSARFESWRPPDGFQSFPSSVEGIVVFGPEPVAEGAAEVEPATTRCPQCGATARFDVARGVLGCGFCGWADAEGATHVGHDAEQGEFTADALSQGASGFGVDRQELGCESCGAVIAVEALALSATCPFCASNQVAVRAHATVSGIRPGAIVPFTIEDRDATAAARTWLGAGWFHPSDLSHLASVQGFTGMYLPFWSFTAQLASDWKAEVGTARQVREYDRASGTTRTRTVIDWRWKHGHVDLPIRDHLVCGTSKVSKRLLGRVSRWDLGAAVAYEPRLLAGLSAVTYDVGLPDAWEAGRHEMREAARVACRAGAGSPHVRNLSMVADLGDEAWRHLLVPAWISAYRYGDRTFVVVVNGQTGSIAGQKPIAWNKVYWAIGCLLAPGVALGLVGIPLLLLGIGVLLLPVALALLVAGLVASGLLWRHAQASEAL